MKTTRHSNRPSLRALLLGVLLVCAAGTATAQSTSGWYQVEVIVFAYTPPMDVEGEQWPADPGKPDLSGAIDLLSEVPDTGASGAAGDGLMAFKQLPASAFKMAGVARRLRQSSQSIELNQEPGGQIQYILSSATGTQEDGDQLGRRKGFRAIM